jgi:hypothetical protein
MISRAYFDFVRTLSVDLTRRKVYAEMFARVYYTLYNNNNNNNNNSNNNNNNIYSYIANVQWVRASNA